MGLLERVRRLVRANLNDLIDRAEEPEKMLRQVLLDMQNQLMQVKTQVAIAVADQHLLEKKRVENEQASADLLRRAELSASKGNDILARAAIEKALGHREMAEAFAQQLVDQKTQVEHLKSAFRELDGKMIEARNRSELLVTRQRRARALSRAVAARALVTGDDTSARMNETVLKQEAGAEAALELAAPDVGDELLALERREKVDAILKENQAKRDQK
jgi:phage shock protein A